MTLEKKKRFADKKSGNVQTFRLVSNSVTKHIINAKGHEKDMKMQDEERDEDEEMPNNILIQIKKKENRAFHQKNNFKENFDSRYEMGISDEIQDGNDRGKKHFSSASSSFNSPFSGHLNSSVSSFLDHEESLIYDLEVRETLEALDDEEYFDDDFNDDLIIQLNREEDVGVLVPCFLEKSFKKITITSPEQENDENDKIELESDYENDEFHDQEMMELSYYDKKNQNANFGKTHSELIMENPRFKEQIMNTLLEHSKDSEGDENSSDEFVILEPEAAHRPTIDSLDTFDYDNNNNGSKRYTPIRISDHSNRKHNSKNSFHDTRKDNSEMTFRRERQNSCSDNGKFNHSNSHYSFANNDSDASDIHNTRRDKDGNVEIKKSVNKGQAIPKEETKEEKKQRKESQKLEQRQKRIEKKKNALMA